MRKSSVLLRALIVVFALLVVQMTAGSFGKGAGGQSAQVVVRGPAPALAAGVPGGEVRGSVLAGIRGSTNSFTAVRANANLKPGGADPFIFLPDVSVYLTDAKTSVSSPVVRTDLDGTFIVPSQPQAVYRLCWKATGYVAGCSPNTITLRGRNVTLNPIVVVPKPGVVYGRVTLADHNACRFVAPFVGVNTSTRVAASGPAGSRVVRANSYGEYVIPGLAAGANVNLVARCEAVQAAGSVAVTGGAVLKNLTLPNSLPIITTALATASGKPVRAVTAGTAVKITVKANAPGGHALHYRWYSDPKASGFASPDAPAANWTVPGPGGATMYVLARDGFGGNVLSRVNLSTTPGKIPFSGHVITSGGAAVPGADVAINGVAGRTNGRGDFGLVLPKEAPRYVVTIEKPGFQLLSRALYAPVTGATFRMFQAQDNVIDPTKPNVVTERPDDKQRSRVTIQVVIPPNSLAKGADGSGALAAGPLHVRPASYDVRNPEDQMPGDYGGTDAGGKAFRLATFGASDVGIDDGAGTRYNLAPGKTAQIKMSIDPAQLASAPATIPLWHYDTRRGLWTQDGTATRAGNQYVATVTHFSAVNMDVAFNNASCTRIVVDTGIMPVPFRLRMTPITGNFTIDAGHQDQVVSDPLNVVVREPPGVQVQFDVVDSNGTIVTAARQIVTTGAASPSGVMWNPPPNPPYADCTSEVDYNVHTVQSLFPVPPQGFLSFRTPANYLDPAQVATLAQAYYAKINPDHTKTAEGDTNDFAHWKTQNGFDAGDTEHVTYQNEYDLGFGRDMHMRKGGNANACPNCVAYYVTNYADVENAVAGTNQAATVAMEYSPQDNVTGTKYTKFYVFGANGAILDSVALDDFGPKAVPTLCIICHSGNITSMGSDGNLQTARFIPFDLQSYRYHPTNAAFSRAAQEPHFKEMNRAIADVTNVTTPVRLLIENWYGTEGDATLPNALFNDNAVPSQWTAPTDQSALYNAVIKPSCRSCHTTRDPSATPADISWQSYDGTNQDSSFIAILTCSPTGAFHHVMPQAERTFGRFWLSTAPNAPNALAASGMDGFQPPNNTCS
jgi:hypothetical protein